jgi:uncharacterized membrane protein (DUF4010 family)
MDNFPAVGLAASLALGLLIGLERGWREREVSDGGRVAGLRTFALTGLFGGLLATLPDSYGPWPLLGGLIGLSLLLAVSYQAASKSSGNLSITSALAMLLTLVLGAIAARGAIALALGAAVLVAVLLDLKPTLHRWLHLIEHRELTATLQLLVLSVVILPNLPDTGFGPYQALNPYRLWWAVVLIAGLSLAGHISMRATGPQRGVFWTGVLGGLASSTAATLALARHAHKQPALVVAAAAGILAACAVMFVRMAVLAVSIQPALALRLGAPLVLTGVLMFGLAIWQWRRRGASVASGADMETVAPFDLGTALGFGAFLAVMAVLIPAVQQWLGTPGVYALAALSGVADVDATVISVSRLHSDTGLSATTTVLALALTALTNMVTKAAIAWTTGGAALGWLVLRGYAITIVVGGAVLGWAVWA